jgi:hypothetical protein
MSTPGAAQIERATQLLANEGDSDNISEKCAAAGGQVYDKLDAHLSTLLGPAGVRALFVRSVKLAQREVASLAALAEFNGLEGSTRLRACLQALEPAAATEAAAVLFATFLDLITGFIGERPTLQVLRNAWPTIE